MYVCSSSVLPAAKRKLCTKRLVEKYVAVEEIDIGKTCVQLHINMVWRRTQFIDVRVDDIEEIQIEDSNSDRQDDYDEVLAIASSQSARQAIETFLKFSVL